MVPGNFTFVVMTDREDLDDQIWRTFVGCGVADERTPRAASGHELREVLRENHRFVFTLIHKFNQPVVEPYSQRDDIIVISDEAHRTQSGKFARNMRLALPNASFIGFTGTPLFEHDHLTRRTFGSYVSRYDFKRSEEDRSTVKLVYENRGEKLGIARLDLNDRIAEKIEEAELDPDQTALLEKLLGHDYEVITAGDRLDKLADDFVEHCSTRWEAGKSMLVCIDKVTCARMLQRIEPRWRFKIGELKARIPKLEAELSGDTTIEERERLSKTLERMRGQVRWMEDTIIEIIISDAQNEVRDFARWDFDIVPHRLLVKKGFETPDGRRITVEDAFKDPHHPFRVAIVCAMWLTGFDVESLSTLYIDKPMKAHTLMQAIARANRVYPGKECGVIVDYNGMLKSLRQALAQYALATRTAVAEKRWSPRSRNSSPRCWRRSKPSNTTSPLSASTGADCPARPASHAFRRSANAADLVCTSDETKRRFEIMARQVFARFKALLTEPSVYRYAERHDADVTDLLKQPHKIVNDAIRAQ